MEMVSDKTSRRHCAARVPTDEMRMDWEVSRQGALPMDKHTVLNDWPIVWHRRRPLRKGWYWLIKTPAMYKCWNRRVVIRYVYQAYHAKSDIIPDTGGADTVDRVPFIVRDLETQSHLIHDVAESHKCILVGLKRASKQDVPARRQELDVPAKRTHRRRHG